MYCHVPFLCEGNDSKIVHAAVQYAEAFTLVCSFVVQLAAMDSSEKRKLIPTGTTPKKAEKLRKKTSESGCTSDHERSPLRTTVGFEGKRLFSSQKVRSAKVKRC